MARIYVSSTFKDLEECREKVRVALKQMGHEDIAMEYYVAENKKPLDKCLEDVSSCDLYIGIFAWRYGYVPDKNGKSITELEYRKAVEAGKECLIFLLREDAPWSPVFVDKGKDAKKIRALRDELSKKYISSFFKSTDELASLVSVAVHRWEIKKINKILSGLANQEEIINKKILFKRTIQEYEHDSCIVLMPFEPIFDELYKIIIKPLIKSIEIKCTRGGIYGAESSINDVWGYMQRPRLIIADLTGQNPNVCYVFGLCHDINKDVIIITQNMNDVPFDLKHLKIISYSNTSEGRIKLQEDLYKAMISLRDGIPLPFEVILKIGETGEHKGQLKNSRDITIDSKNNIFISDGDNYRIQKFSSNGEFITSWGSHGHKEGEFDDIRGIAVDKYDHVYIADFSNNRVQKFSENGLFLSQFKFDNEKGVISTPYGIAISKFNEIYLTNAEPSNLIMRFNENGKLLRYWGGYGKINEKFDNPLGITIDDEGNVYIVDNKNHRIQKFNREGNFLLKWGHKSDMPGNFMYPRGIAFKNNRIYVSETDIPRVQIFDKNGKYLGKMRTEPNVPLHRPTGMVFDQNDHLYLVNRGLNMVLKLKQIVEEIQKKTEVIREQTKGTQFEELGNELNQSSQFISEIRDPVGLGKKVMIMQNTLEVICSKLPEGQKGETCELLKIMFAEPLIEDKISILDNILSKFSYQLDMMTYLNRIEEKLDHLDNIRFDIFKIKLNYHNVISNLDAMTKELEKLNNIESSKAFSIEKLNSNQSEKLNDLNNEIQKRLSEIEILVDGLPKNNDNMNILVMLNELKQSKLEKLLQTPASVAGLISFLIQIVQLIQPYVH